MKNLHVLSTDKPSRLYYNIEIPNNFIYNANNFPLHEDLIKDKFQPQNIYITSDEEIKEGDWVLYLEDLTIGKVKDAKDKHNIEIVYNNQGVGLSCNVKDCSEAIKYPIIKIILTTDQDLIKNGVQAIDDEFLEWICKNPSCESVEVEIICGVCGVEGKEDDIDVCGRSKECARGWISDKYKIIIPRKIIQIYKINDLKEAFLKGYVAKNNKEDYPFAVQKFLNSKLNENKK